MNNVDIRLLKEIADLEGTPKGAYNIRKNGQLDSRKTTANIDIVTKEDKPGIDIHIKPGTKHQSVHIPVLLTETGLDDLVYNDFFIGPDCDVVIVAGCGIHNEGSETSKHDGVHTFYVGENSKVHYVEKHYGEGEGTGERIMNPQTIVYLEKGASIQLDTTPPLHQGGREGGRRGLHQRKAADPRQAEGRVRDGRDLSRPERQGSGGLPVRGPG